MSWNLKQRLAAEMLGTMTFLYIVSAADEDVFVGLGLFTSLCFFGSISGGHFNPATTITQIICDGQDFKEGLQYMLAQIVGGFLGVGVCFLATGGYKTPLIDFQETQWKGLLSEVIGQMGYCFMVLAQTTRKTQISKSPLIAYGLIALQLNVFRECAKISSAVLNPAVAITFQLFSVFESGDPSYMASLFVFLACDFGGAIIMSLLFQQFTKLLGEQNQYELIS